MDLAQRKLVKSEWESIEIPVSSQEKKILQMINDGYNNTNIHSNINQSLYSFVKIDKNDGTELMLFQKYFEPNLRKLFEKYGKKTPLENIHFPESVDKIKTLKKIDKLRIQNLESNIGDNKS